MVSVILLENKVWQIIILKIYCTVGYFKGLNFVGLYFCGIPTLITDLIAAKSQFLNQAHAWFLKIDPVRIVGVRVCARVRGY